MRVHVILVAVAMVLAPTVAAISTRETVHEPLVGELTPAPADEEAQPQDVTINCGNNTDLFAMSENDRGQNDPLPCWNDGEYADDNYWTDGSGDMVGASPPFYKCVAEGVDLDISLQNPFPVFRPDGVSQDAASSQGVIVSTGAFFAVPQISGDDAAQVTSVWFGFAETAPSVAETAGPSTACADGKPAPGGAYYELYRGDTDASDGWRIPINTLLVPDNLYGAHLRVFGTLSEDAPTTPTGGERLLATASVYAMVDNEAQDETQNSCTPSAVECAYQDLQPPWALVTPGDSPFDNFDQSELDSNDQQGVVEGWTVEFGSPVQTGQTTIEIDRHDGEGFQPVTTEPTESSADVDPLPVVTVLEDPNWGPKYVFDNTELHKGDTVKVSMTGSHGHLSTKTVTVG